jgi:ankyrin repeat protein/tRNA A-37 threonylcarbamoyl transferase component Bud32
MSSASGTSAATGSSGIGAAAPGPAALLGVTASVGDSERISPRNSGLHAPNPPSGGKRPSMESKLSSLPEFEAVSGLAMAAPPPPPQQKQQSEPDPMSPTRDGKHVSLTGLLYAVAQSDVGEVQRLLSSGVDVNGRDYDKRTAAHIAAGEGSVAVLALLQKHGANLSAKDRWGGTPMDDALTENKQEAVAFLKTANVKSGGRRPKRTVSSVQPVSIITERDPTSDVSRFLQAAFMGDLGRLRSSTINVNSADYDARTALHVACSEGNLEVVQYLVDERKALINQRDRWGHTPLDDALRGQYQDVADYLREHGGETTGAYDGDGTLKSVTDEEMNRLQQRGINEKWAINNDEILSEDKPFARGAGGELYKARWRGLRVVVKSCKNMVGNRQALLDLGNEIALLSTVRHPNLIMFLGASFAVFPPVLLMEYAQGGTLEERIVRAAYDGQALPRREKVKFTYELALALNFLHLCRPSIVHRDLKPSNILLTADLNVRVTDFGLSKFIPSKNRKLGDTFKMTGETGSYRFMAPEVFKHEQYNEKVDVYSFALIVYWMQTGIKPFVQLADPVAAVRAAAVDGLRPNFSPNFDKGIKNLLSATWEQLPEKRPSFAEVLDMLEKLGYDSFSMYEQHKKCSIF